MSERIVRFIGCGAMGSALIKAVAKSSLEKKIIVSARHFENAQKVSKKYKCLAVQKNTDEIQNADFVFLAMKPQQVETVAREIKNALSKKSLIISMLAGVSLEKLETLFGARCIRLMPNMGALVGSGMTALCRGKNVSDDEVLTVEKLLARSGEIEEVNEHLMDCVTAVSGSSPAFVFLFIEALADSAVRFGLTRKQAYHFASQTVFGSARLALESGKLPSELKDLICSPNGTTIEGVASLEKNGFRSAIFEAVKASFEKAQLL